MSSEGVYLRNRSRDRVRNVSGKVFALASQMKSPNFFCGTSGLVLPVPNKQAFPPEYRAGTRLTYYASIFNSLEVNSSFYKIPQPKTLARWTEEVSPGFRFTVKLWRGITHQPLLDFKIDDVERFMLAARALKPNKGCLLIQLPPGAKADQAPQLELLLDTIRQYAEGWKIAVEFRDRSWYVDATDALLERFHAARVLQDMPASAIWRETTIASFVYLRYHGPQGDYRGGYSQERLKQDVASIKKWLSEGKEVYVYFNNTIGNALPDARYLADQL